VAEIKARPCETCLNLDPDLWAETMVWKLLSL